MAADEGHATVVSNSSSHNSFVGLGGAGSSNRSDALSTNWGHNNIHDHSNFNNTSDNNYSINYNSNNMSSDAPITQGAPPPNSSQGETSSSNNINSTMPFHNSSLIVSNNNLPILPSAGLAVPSAPNNNTVPEFLYQLTKMLTGGHNDIIEWSNGRIEVHNPHKLESTVLQRYFRHSKFASFQRQLNYFGFRKLAGKGKMAPCSYVNEAATPDIGSLLLIKRKATALPKDKNGRKQAAEKTGGKAVHPPVSTAHGILHQMNDASNSRHRTVSSASGNGIPQGDSQQAIAQAAVGRGIRHSFGLGTTSSSSGEAPSGPASSALDTNTNFVIPTRVEDSLSQLASNYHNSLAADNARPEHAVSQGQRAQEVSPGYSAHDPFPSLLSRNSSLIDLAMIPDLDDGEPDNVPSIPGMHFVDFPQPEVDPSKTQQSSLKQEEGEEEEHQHQHTDHSSI